MAGQRSSTRRRLLEILRRQGPRTISELSRPLGLSTMAIRLHIQALAAEGMVRASGTKPSRGRPARVWALTREAGSCFPQASGELALALLEEVERRLGRSAVEDALRDRSRRILEVYRVALDGARGPDRVRALAGLRDAEGYVAEAEVVRRSRARHGQAAESDGQPIDLVERHCPIRAVAERWPEACKVEAELLRAALGQDIERVEHLQSGDGCCRYRVGEVV